jgi:glycosyltransferase involved in cell wall biosynthesis
MRIASVCTSDIPSSKANAIQVMKVMDSLLALDHQVRLWSPGESVQTGAYLNQLYGVERIPQLTWVESRPKWKRYDFILQSFLQVYLWKPDLLYTWTLQTAVLGLIFNLPVILELHDRTTGKIGKRAFRYFIKHKGKKRLLVITRALKMALEQEHGIDLSNDDVSIAPNGIDLRQYPVVLNPSEARDQLNLPQQFTAVFTGHFYAGRGIELLFGLAQSLPQIQFLWVGGTEDAVASWQQRLNVAGIKNVILTGFVPQQKLPLYQSAGDVLLMPYGAQIAGSSGGNSVDICSPMKMFDYLATGRPILSSDLPVLYEVLSKGNTVFCPPKEIQIWADQLQRLFDDPDQCQRMGAHARELSHHYSWIDRTKSALEGFDAAD